MLPSLIFQDILGKSDPYLVLSRQLPDGTKVVVHKTEVLWCSYLTGGGGQGGGNLGE